MGKIRFRRFRDIEQLLNLSRITQHTPLFTSREPSRFRGYGTGVHTPYPGIPKLVQYTPQPVQALRVLSAHP